MDYSLAYQSMNAIILLQFFCENSSTFLRQSRCCFLDDHLQLWVLITRILEIQETVSNLHRKNVTHFPVWRSSFCCPEFPGKQRAAQSPSSSTAICVFLSASIGSRFYISPELVSFCSHKYYPYYISPFLMSFCSNTNESSIIIVFRRENSFF